VPVAAVTVVVGDDEFLVGRAVQRSVRARVADDPAAVVTDVAAGALSVNELAEVTSPSLFGGTLVVVVRSVQDASKELGAALTRAAERADSDLVLVHAGGAKGRALLETLKGTGARVVEVGRVRNAREREDFVAAEVKAAGGSITREAVTELVAAVGTDLRELATACIQLVSDVGRRITAEHVAVYHRGRVEATGYAVADRAVEGDLAGALETWRWAAATGLDPVLVSSALAANLRTIAAVASAGRGSPDALAGRLGLPAWKVRRAQGWTRRWHPDSLARAVQAVAVADADIKGEGADAAYAAERAIVTVAGCVGG
jgi:DNA polymerase III subunit delta